MLSSFLSAYYKYRIKDNNDAENKLKKAMYFIYWGEYDNIDSTLRLVKGIKYVGSMNTIYGLIDLKKKIVPKWWQSALWGFTPLSLLIILDVITGWNLPILKVIPPLMTLIPLYEFRIKVKKIDKLIDKYRNTV